MNLREDYRQITTRILCVNNKEISRNQEKRRVYRDRTTGNCYVRSMGRIYRLNEQLEWRQEANDVLFYRQRDWT